MRMCITRPFGYGSGKAMISKSLWPSASIPGCREDICATAKTPSGLVIPFFAVAGHGLNIPPRPKWFKMGNDHAQFQGKDLKTPQFSLSSTSTTSNIYTFTILHPPTSRQNGEGTRNWRVLLRHAGWINQHCSSSWHFRWHHPGDLTGMGRISGVANMDP